MKFIQLPNRADEVLFLLADSPQTSNGLAAQLHKDNKDIVEEAWSAIYQCTVCKKSVEKTITDAIRNRCNRIVTKWGKKCSGDLIKVKDMGKKLVLKPYNSTYEQDVRLRILKPLQNRKLVALNSKTGFYSLNLEGIYNFLKVKNPRFDSLIKRKFHKGRKSLFVLSSFKKHLIKISKILQKGKRSQDYKGPDIANYWTFAEAFRAFIYKYGWLSFQMGNVRKTAKAIKDIEKKDKRFKTEFILVCKVIWTGTLEFMTYIEVIE